MPLRFYLDHDSSAGRVVRGLRTFGFDLVTAAELGKQLDGDGEHLANASELGRVLYTANVRDFARLHRDWMAAGRSHAGIVVRRNQLMSIGGQIRGLRLISAAFDEWDAKDMFEYLDVWVSRVAEPNE